MTYLEGLILALCVLVSLFICWWQRRRLPDRLYPELARFTTEKERQDALKQAYGSDSKVQWAAFLGVPLVVLPVKHLLPWRLLQFPLVIVLAASWGFGTTWIGRRRVQRALRLRLLEHGVPICLTCGYDLTGNTSGRCPECGTKANQP